MKSEKQRLSDAVDEFASAMKKRLISKQKQGWYGWESVPKRELSNRMLLNASSGREKYCKKSLIDMANLAMMVWRRK